MNVWILEFCQTWKNQLIYDNLSSYLTNNVVLAFTICFTICKVFCNLKCKSFGVQLVDYIKKKLGSHQIICPHGEIDSYFTRSHMCKFCKIYLGLVYIRRQRQGWIQIKYSYWCNHWHQPLRALHKESRLKNIFFLIYHFMALIWPQGKKKDTYQLGKPICNP